MNVNVNAFKKKYPNEYECECFKKIINSKESEYNIQFFILIKCA